ncbi:filamentous hemagglutinin N-terminal domain-containing protein [Thermomonas brevis]|uniref:Filamentous hemagglutinin N-terminal domain-containing protein n=1 Tax=Thermomonas brevis TaxID=215691 RepID=A0A7G9QT24_9GAMM|nr:GLUG motif-containing protein [Thermomonas brevis]QNN46499.1 filamentous hemagglutinin N-terminal domain-containing protein [Thermomonas brevis]
MNRAFRIVFNRALGVWQVVSEITRSQGKGLGARGGLRLFVLLPLAAWASLGWAANAPPVEAMRADGGGAGNAGGGSPAASVFANQLPTGGTVSAGSGSIAQSGAAMTITQTTQNLAINWQSFDIGQSASVTFLQPNATAIALNRVLSGDTTHILGQLKGNGQVWVLNPNGVLFGGSAQVNVGGLVASTLGLSDADFMAGKRSFAGSGGSVVNQGSLTGGYVALLGENVRNEGTITARLGTAALAAGNRVTLDFNGDQLLNVQVDEGALHALADNRGLIQADGGSVLMTARARDALLDTAVNNTGIIRARTVEHRNGRILLLGDMAGGTVNVAGTLDASAPDGGNGGFIETSAAHVKVADSAVITTKAASGQNGKWLIDPTDFTVAKSGGDMTGAALTNALANGDVEIQSTAGGSGVSGDVNIKDTVSWSQNTLTLNAQRDINVFSTMNASGTAGLFFRYGQADAGGSYNIYAPVNLASTGSFRTQSGSAGGITNWTIITSLGSETDVTGNTGTTLQGIWGNLGGNFVLGADINASATAGWNGGLGFTPIGGNDPGASSNPGFTGNFDGLGHVIDGLTINTPNNNIGLFGSAFYASIANIGLTHASITGQFSVGGLAGRSGNLHIHNSYVSGAITGATAVGGLVGNDIYPRGTNVLEHVWTAGSVTATAASTGTGSLVGIAGGLVGDNAAAIRNSYSTADVRGGNQVGGLAGRIFSDIDKSYFAGTVGSNGVAGGDGTVKAPYALGALVGQMTGSGTVSNSFWNTDTAGAVGVGRIEYTGVFNGVGLTTAQMRNAANWAGFDFVTTPGQGGWVLLDGVLPMLSSEWSPVIRNAHQLQLMALDLSANYTLANDIDASATNGAAGDVWYGGSFSPIGTAAAKFTGSFDGQDHVIDGLTIHRNAQDYVGLFGYASGGTLQDVTLSGVSIQGGNAYVGALAGFVASGGTVSNTHASGSVSGNLTRVGGLIGRNEGSIGDSSADVTVSGQDRVGGLVGSSSGAISNSTAAGSVTNTGSYTGGLVGYTEAGGTVSDSTATGAVSGTQRVGGLVGEAHAAITGSTASAQVTGSSDYIGGLVGATDSAITDSHASGVVQGRSYVGGLAGWSSAAITGSTAAGTVTANVSYAGGLVGLASGSASRVTDSVASGAVQGAFYVGGLAGGSEGAVGNSQASGTVTASGANSGAGGLVGYNKGAVTDSHASGDVNSVSGDTGGLIGLSTSGAISNSYATGAVNSNGTGVGGLVGTLGGGSTLTNSYATGSIHGASRVGGLVGQLQAAISNSYATGTVSSTSGQAGGLVGYNLSAGGSISNSYSSGTVSGSTNSIGGLVGYNLGSVTGSYWNTTTSGLFTSAGGTGLTTAQMMDATSFTGWSLSGNGGENTVWRIYEGQTTPLLRSFLKQITIGATPDFDGTGSYLANIASASFNLPTGGHVYGTATVNNGDTLTLNSTAAGEYTATSNATLTGSLYSDQQGYDITYGSSGSRIITTPGSAAGDIWLPGSITWGSGTLAIDTSGALTTGGSGVNTTAINGDAFRLVNGAWRQNAATLAGFSVNDFQFVGGIFLRALGGDGSDDDNAYQIADVYGLQGMASTTLLDKHFTLANDMDASGTAGWNGGAGFVSVGTAASKFTGSFDGQGHVIDGLTIDRGAQDNVGLFGYAGDGAFFANVGLSNANITGRAFVGTLLGKAAIPMLSPSTTPGRPAPSLPPAPARPKAPSAAWWAA